MAYFGGGDIKKGCFLENLHLGVLLLQSVEVIPLARVNDNGVVVKNLPVVFPAIKERHIVGADDERETVLWVGAGESCECVNGVGRSRKAELEVADSDMRLVFERLLCERESEIFIPQAVFFLERVVGRQHEPHFVETALAQDVLRQGDMPEMNRVERAEVESYLHDN